MVRIIYSENNSALDIPSITDKLPEKNNSSTTGNKSGKKARHSTENNSEKKAISAVSENKPAPTDEITSENKSVSRRLTTVSEINSAQKKHTLAGNKSGAELLQIDEKSGWVFSLVALVLVGIGLSYFAIKDKKKN